MSEAVEQTIASLTQDHQARKRYCPRLVFFALFALALLYGGWFIQWKGLNAPLDIMLSNPLRLLAISLLSVIALCGLYVSAFTPIPGARAIQRITPFLHVFSMLYVVLQVMRMALSGKLMWHYGMECSCVMWAALIPPLLIFFLLSKRGAVIHAQLAGSSVALAFGAVALIALHVVDDMEDGLHILIWHILPLALGIGIASLIAKKILRW